MLVIPAIDLKDGKCVRLRQGLMDESTVFSEDPLATAAKWVEQGARRLHLVDLNGAFAGKPVNGGVVTEIARKWPDLPIQIGGGIREPETIEHYLNAGVQFVIIGTQAVKEPQFVTQMCQAFPGRIIVGVDAKNGLVATDGWAEVSDMPAIDLVRQFADDGVSAVIYTDIARDGMMQGVNIDATERLAEASGIPIVASGGVTNMDDIRRLVNIEAAGVVGVITGRAIYEGSLDLAEAQTWCDNNPGGKSQ